VKLRLILKCRTEMCKAAVYQGTCTGGGAEGKFCHIGFSCENIATTVYIR